MYDKVTSYTSLKLHVPLDVIDITFRNQDGEVINIEYSQSGRYIFEALQEEQTGNVRGKIVQLINEELDSLNQVELNAFIEVQTNNIKKLYKSIESLMLKNTNEITEEHETKILKMVLGIIDPDEIFNHNDFKIRNAIKGVLYVPEDN